MGLFVKSLQAAFFQPFTRIVRALFKMANMWLFSLIELKHYLVMNTQIHLDICKTAVFIWAQWLLGQFIKIEHKYKRYFVRLHEKQRCWRCLFRILTFLPSSVWTADLLKFWRLLGPTGGAVVVLLKLDLQVFYFKLNYGVRMSFCC